jgi:hypothetical protein
MQMLLIVISVLCVVASVHSFAPKARISGGGSSALGFFGKKAAPEPEPEPVKPVKRGMFSFGKKEPAPAPAPPAPAKKAGLFSFGGGGKKATVEDKDDDWYDPEGKENDPIYKARRVARWMTAPFIYESWDSTEEQARKTIKIKSPPTRREKMYAAQARGELSQDEIDSIRTNPY